MVPKPVYNPNNYKHLSQEHQDNYRKAAEYPHIFYFQATKTFVAFRLKPDGQWLPVAANKDIKAADKKYQSRMQWRAEHIQMPPLPPDTRTVEQREQGKQDMAEITLGMEKAFKNGADLSSTSQHKDTQ
jgi:hypothetical protein